MIVELAQDSCELVKVWHEYKQSEAVLTDIKNTHEELDLLVDEFSQINKSLHLASSRFKEEQRKEIVKRLGQILPKLRDLKEKFNIKRLQVKEIRDVNNEVKNLRSFAVVYWSDYAKGQINQYFELLKIVNQLPEIKRQKNEIEALTVRLDEQSEILPQNKGQLDRFDKDLNELSDRLASLRSLPLKINRFLEKVGSGKFTIADLDDEILEWCSKGDRGRSFRILF